MVSKDFTGKGLHVYIFLCIGAVLAFSAFAMAATLAEQEAIKPVDIDHKSYPIGNFDENSSDRIEAAAAVQTNSGYGDLMITDSIPSISVDKEAASLALEPAAILFLFSGPIIVIAFMMEKKE